MRQGIAEESLQRALYHLGRNAFDEAEHVLTDILARQPENAQALQLLGLARAGQGKPCAAEALYRRSLALDAGQPQVHYNLGVSLAAQGRHKEASAAFGAATAQRPNYAEAYLGLALAEIDLGEPAAAERSCRAALRVQPNYLAAKQALATALCRLDRAPEAETILRRALAAGVRDPRQLAALEHELGLALKRQDRFAEALTLFDSVQAKVPDLPAVETNRAGTLQQLGRNAEARAAYARAAAREPRNVEALAGLALMSALTGDFDAARGAGESALLLDPGKAVAHIAIAIADIDANEFERATRRLESVLESSPATSDAACAFALGFAADALERKGRCKEAFSLYAESNIRKRAIQHALEPVRASRDVERLAEWFADSPRWTASATAPPPKTAAAQHVFILGFMRTGSTLLETILATNPQVLDIDEIEFLTDAARSFLLDSAGLARLAALGAREIAQWQDAYWKKVRMQGLDVTGKTFIDKMPFNVLRLPLIARLFPAAKIVFTVRDPRDVVISCFRRRFNPTPFSYEFFDVEDCARFYAATMSLAELYRDKLPIVAHEHRYEDMIANFDESMRAVCGFTGIEWTSGMRDFRRRAEAIDARSASALQVQRGLYREGVGQWRRYHEQMERVMPILQPWLHRFGYD